MRKLGIFTLLTLLFSQFGWSQSYILLSKRGGKHHLRFYQGQTIRFKLHGENYFNTCMITTLRGEVIGCQGYYIHPREIAEISIQNTYQKGANLAQYGIVLGIAGVGYLLIDNLNRSVVNKEPWRVNRRVAAVSGGLLATGGGVYLLRKKSVKVGRKWKLTILTE
jgi:hypothetical protein